MNIEQLMELKLARETGIRGENLTQCHSLHYKVHMT
jgi:hypothetical protein